MNHFDTNEGNPRKFQWFQKHWSLLLGSQTIRVEVKENDLKSNKLLHPFWGMKSTPVFRVLHVASITS